MLIGSGSNVGCHHVLKPHAELLLPLHCMSGRHDAKNSSPAFGGMLPETLNEADGEACCAHSLIQHWILHTQKAQHRYSLACCCLLPAPPAVAPRLEPLKGSDIKASLPDRSKGRPHDGSGVSRNDYSFVLPSLLRSHARSLTRTSCPRELFALLQSNVQPRVVCGLGWPALG